MTTPWRGGMLTLRPTPEGHVGVMTVCGRNVEIRAWHKTAGGSVCFEARDMGPDDWVDRNFGGGEPCDTP